MLAGNPDLRVPKGLELVREGVSDLLVLSDGMRIAPRLCRRADVLCFRPDPYSTTGEAEAVARLARDRGWDSLTVVTSTYHVYRARLLFGRCLDRSVRVVGAGQPGWVLPRALAFETARLFWALAIDRDC